MASGGSGGAIQRDACPDLRLAAYAFGAVDEEERRELARHIDSCARCSALVETIARAGVDRADTDDNPVAPGDIVGGKYRVDARIGSGGMGVVFRATHRELKRDVAIKFMFREQAGQTMSEKRFAREARAAATLKSEHAVKILDIDRLPGGRPYLVMEYLEGRDLNAILEERGPLPVVEVLGYAIQACDALAEAQQRGIVHRDVKPHNLFLTTEGVVKVFDFGLAKQVAVVAPTSSEQTAAHMILGSLHYMSPEQLRRAAEVDSATDIWSFGATLHHLLTGTTPFPDGNAYVLGSRILSDDPPRIDTLRQGLPHELVTLVERCMRKEKSERPASFVEIRTSLEATRRWILDGGDAAVSSAPPTPRAPTPQAVSVDVDVDLDVDGPPSSDGPTIPATDRRVPKIYFDDPPPSTGDSTALMPETIERARREVMAAPGLMPPRRTERLRPPAAGAKPTPPPPAAPPPPAPMPNAAPPVVARAIPRVPNEPTVRVPRSRSTPYHVFFFALALLFLVAAAMVWLWPRG